MVYHFEAVQIGDGLENPHNLADFKRVHSKWDEAFREKGWLSIFLANHDEPRMVSRFGNDSDEFRAVSAKMLNTFLLTMRGTPYCYFGDELGMKNIYFEDISEYKDIAAINGYKKALREGKDMQKFMQNLKFYSRDNSRTPMQWNDSENAGFTTGSPWISVNKDYSWVNVEVQEKSSESVLNHFRAMTKLRTENDILVYGKYDLLEADNSEIYAYTRTLDDQSWLVVLSFVDTDTMFKLANSLQHYEVLANNYSELSHEGETIKLKPYQAVVLSAIV